MPSLPIRLRGWLKGEVPGYPIIFPAALPTMLPVPDTPIPTMRAAAAMISVSGTVAITAILGHGPLHPPSVAIFCVMAAAFHTYGYLSNRRSYPETGAGHTPIKSSDAGASARVGHPSG